MEVLLGLAVPAIVKALELINRKDWLSLTKILASAAIGLTAGILGFEGLTWLTGLAAGLAASGLMTVAGYTGEKAAKVLAKAEAEAVTVIERKF
jgi:hypothetical protein